MISGCLRLCSRGCCGLSVRGCFVLHRLNALSCIHRRATLRRRRQQRFRVRVGEPVVAQAIDPHVCLVRHGARLSKVTQQLADSRFVLLVITILPVDLGLMANLQFISLPAPVQLCCSSSICLSLSLSRRLRLCELRLRHSLFQGCTLSAFSRKCLCGLLSLTGLLCHHGFVFGLDSCSCFCGGCLGGLFGLFFLRRRLLLTDLDNGHCACTNGLRAAFGASLAWLHFHNLRRLHHLHRLRCVHLGCRATHVHVHTSIG